MSIRPFRLSRPLVLGLALAASGAVAAQEAMSEAQVRAALEAEGYRDVHDLEFEHGLWKADARSADGSRIDVRLDPASAEAFPDNAVAKVSANDVRARLSAAGYQHVDDVEFDDGIWKAEARNAQGQKMELRIAPTDGRILHERVD